MNQGTSSSFSYGHTLKVRHTQIMYMLEYLAEYFAIFICYFVKKIYVYVAADNVTCICHIATTTYNYTHLAADYATGLPCPYYSICRLTVPSPFFLNCFVLLIF